MDEEEEQESTGFGVDGTLTVTRDSDKTETRQLTETVMSPFYRHAINSLSLGHGAFSGVAAEGASVSIGDGSDILEKTAAAVRDGDLDALSDLLTAQAVSCDALFTEMSRRALNNLGQFPETAGRYMNLAMRAQTNTRTTIEALAKIHRKGEQTVRHVHVWEGGQAVFADQLHHYAAGGLAGGNEDQAYEQQHSCSDESPALSGPDPTRDGVPVPGDEGKEAVPNSRGCERHGSTKGE